MTFDAAASDALYSDLRSAALATALFQNVNMHEPKNAPGNRLYCSIILDGLAPVPSSGLAQTSGKVTFKAKVWAPAEQRPLDKIDSELLAATATLMAALSGQYTFGGSVRNIDLFGMSMVPGWVDFDGKQFRVTETTIGVVINDMFAQEA